MNEILNFLIVITALAIVPAYWRYRKQPQAPRVRIVVREEREMSEREILAALRVDGQSPLWRAMQQLLAQQIEAAKAECIDADNQLKQPLPTYYAGSQMALERLRDFLLTERERALVEAEED